MKWKKSEYNIQVRIVDGMYRYMKATGYTCDLTEGLTVGITNKMPVDGVKWRPAGFWTMTILPEGMAFKTFKTKKTAQEFIELEVENLKKYVADCRRRMNHGSVDAAHD